MADFTLSSYEVKIAAAKVRLANDTTPSAEDLAVVSGYREPK